MSITSISQIGSSIEGQSGAAGVSGGLSGLGALFASLLQGSLGEGENISVDGLGALGAGQLPEGLANGGKNQPKLSELLSNPQFAVELNSGEGNPLLIKQINTKIAGLSEMAAELEAVLNELHANGINPDEILDGADLSSHYEKMGLSASQASEKAKSVVEIVQTLQSELLQSELLNEDSLHKLEFKNIPSNQVLGFDIESHGMENFDSFENANLAMSNTHNLTSDDILNAVVAGRALFTDSLVKGSGETGDVSMSAGLSVEEDGETLLASKSENKNTIGSQVRHAAKGLNGANQSLAQTVNADVEQQAGVTGNTATNALKDAEVDVINAREANQANAERARVTSGSELTAKSAEKAVGILDEDLFGNKINKPTSNNANGVQRNEIHATTVFERSEGFATGGSKSVFQWTADGNGGSQLSASGTGIGINGEIDSVAGETGSKGSEAVSEIAEQADEMMEMLNRRDTNMSNEKALAKNGLNNLARESNVASQVNVKIRQLASGNGGQVKLTLHPEDLGQVDIKLEISGGKVNGSITVQNVEVAEQLARDLRQLQQGLTESGLELGSEGIEFLVSDQDAGHGGNQGENQEGNSQHAQSGQNDSNLDGLSDATQNDTVAWKNPDNLLDVSI